ncbi:epoxide hydrolase family protein [Sphingomonas profundi]|uniref:epoxide hydrolase family protein n=1 Tax=Alterirhizorhabdus profundi TaxID=2681549 RepID=UPI0012E70A4D|nr:epoxide hydrolase [Sphingomonas profundi]
MTPFTIAVPDETLRDLQERLARTRPAGDTGFARWDDGTPPDYAQALVAHWRDRFDWRAREAALNRFDQVRGEIDGTRLHCIHQRGIGPAPLPLLLVHGYPDSIWRFEKIIPLLTDPGAHGGDPADAFHVVAPSLPGYGWSDPLAEAGGTFRFGDLFAGLMSTLGYDRYGAHGGDWGSTVVELLARSHARHVAGIHLTDVPFWHSFDAPKDPSPAEARFLAESKAWQMQHGAYTMIQGTRPATPATALADSPAGLAAWIVEKFREWSDCGGDVETRFSKDELLTNVMIYWATGTIGSAFLPYRDFTKAGATRWLKEAARGWLGSDATPAAFALFPKDIGTPPRAWAKRFFNVTRWTEMPRGGHFAAYEEPELLAEDIRAFFRDKRA